LSVDLAEQFRHRHGDGTDLPIFQNKNVAAPVDVMSAKAGEPHPEGDQVAQRHEPEMARDRGIAHHAAHLKSNRSAEQSGSAQYRPGPPCPVR